MSGKKGLNLAAMKKALEAERESLMESSEATSEDRDPVTLDPQIVGRLSRMDAMQVQAMAQASEARRQGRLQRIEAALKRIEDGSYGECLDCGEEIAAKRLAVDPTATLCIDCAQ
jgi:DnaK suppressor protein